MRNELPETVKSKVLSYLNSEQLIKHLFVSKYFRKIIILKFEKYFDLSTGFCSVFEWDLILFSNLINMLQRMNAKVEKEFDIDNIGNKISNTILKNLSLFSVCLHHFRCVRSCDKESVYCFYCSRVRCLNFALTDRVLSVVLENIEDKEDYEYLYLDDKEIDFDVFLLGPPYFNYPNYPLQHEKCDYFEVFSNAQEICISFVSIMLRLMINYYTEFFSKWKLTLSYEEAVIKEIYIAANELFQTFFKEANCLFFYGMFDCFEEVNRSNCYEIIMINHNLDLIILHRQC